MLKYSASVSAPTSGHPSRPLSQPQGDRPSKGLGRNPTIKISRATRVSEQWNASLDREITNANELRHLDEFLGNQVSKKQSAVRNCRESFFQSVLLNQKNNLFVFLYRSMISVPGGSLCQPQRPSLLQPLCSSERLSKTCILSQ